VYHAGDGRYISVSAPGLIEQFNFVADLQFLKQFSPLFLLWRLQSPSSTPSLSP